MLKATPQVKREEEEEEGEGSCNEQSKVPKETVIITQRQGSEKGRRIMKYSTGQPDCLRMCAWVRITYNERLRNS